MYTTTKHWYREPLAIVYFSLIAVPFFLSSLFWLLFRNHDIDNNNNNTNGIIESRARTANKLNSWKPFRFSFRRCLSHTNNLYWCLVLSLQCTRRKRTKTPIDAAQKNRSFHFLWFDLTFSFVFFFILRLNRSNGLCRDFNFNLINLISSIVFTYQQAIPLIWNCTHFCRAWQNEHNNNNQIRFKKGIIFMFHVKIGSISNSNCCRFTRIFVSLL